MEDYMDKMIEQKIWDKSHWYIFIPGGRYACVIGKTGQYETELSKALAFDSWIEAVKYSEKHGYGKIATIRKVVRNV